MTAANMVLATAAVQCSADTFAVNQSLVILINPDICQDGENATFAKPENDCSYLIKTTE